MVDPVRHGGRRSSTPQPRTAAAPSPALAQTVGAVAKLHADHQKAATTLQRAASVVVKSLGRPAFIVLLLLLIGSWTSGSLLVQAYGWTPYDPPPFVWLQLAASVTALCITILILATQRRDDEIAERREHLALELAILSEQKLAKVIELLEESRRDNPLIPDRVDTSANAMARPTDPAWLANSVKTENNH